MFHEVYSHYGGREKSLNQKTAPLYSVKALQSIINLRQTIKFGQSYVSYDKSSFYRIELDVSSKQWQKTNPKIIFHVSAVETGIGNFLL